MRVPQPDHPTSCGLFAPLGVACAVMFVVAGTVNLFPAWMERQENRGEVALDARMAVSDAMPEDYVPLSGLIDPHNGDFGTDPARTFTGMYNRGELFVLSLMVIPYAISVVCVPPAGVWRASRGLKQQQYPRKKAFEPGVPVARVIWQATP